MQPTEIYPGIVVDPAILGGKPMVKSTRIAVSLVLGQLAAGLSSEDLQREYHVSPEQIRTVLAYAARLVANEAVFDVAP